MLYEQKNVAENEHTRKHQMKTRIHMCKNKNGFFTCGTGRGEHTASWTKVTQRTRRRAFLAGKPSAVPVTTSGARHLHAGAPRAVMAQCTQT